MQPVCTWFMEGRKQVYFLTGAAGREEDEEIDI
jgi:hypothetical protein